LDRFYSINLLRFVQDELDERRSTRARARTFLTMARFVSFKQGRRGSNTDSDHHMKRSQSVSQQLGGKPSSDLLGLNLFNPSSTPSSASTPTGSHPYAPLQSPPPLSTSPTPSQPPLPQSAPPTHAHSRFPGKSPRLASASELTREPAVFAVVIRVIRVRSFDTIPYHLSVLGLIARAKLIAP